MKRAKLELIAVKLKGGKKPELDIDGNWVYITETTLKTKNHSVTPVVRLKIQSIQKLNLEQVNKDYDFEFHTIFKKIAKRGSEE